MGRRRGRRKLEKIGIAFAQIFAAKCQIQIHAYNWIQIQIHMDQNIFLGSKEGEERRRKGSWANVSLSALKLSLKPFRPEAAQSLSAFPLIPIWGELSLKPRIWGKLWKCENVSHCLYNSVNRPRRDHHPNGTKFSGKGSRPGGALVGALFPNLRPLGKMSPEMLPLITIFPTFLPQLNHFNQQETNQQINNKKGNTQRCIDIQQQHSAG